MCPDSSCNQQLSYQEIKTIVRNKELVKKFEDFSLSRVLEKMPNMRWCPRPGCGNAMIGHKNALMVVCSNDSCRFCFCFKCNEAWHSDATCAQYQSFKKDQANGGLDSLRRWVASNAKICPNAACQSPIEKNGGCNHMTCVKCKHEFCWSCMGTYTSSHFSDGSTCHQFS